MSITCPNCGTNLEEPLPPSCPNCFAKETDIRAALVEGADGNASQPDADQPVEEPSGERSIRSDDVDEAASGSPCSTPGCTGVAVSGDLCPTCALANPRTHHVARLSGSWGTIEVPSGARVGIGRDVDFAPTTATLLESALNISRRHGYLENRGGSLLLVDHSSNGTVINGEALAPNTERELLPDDHVVLGRQVEFVVEAP